MRVTLDSSLQLSDELDVPEGQLWRDMTQGLGRGGLVLFPYDILEIKLQVTLTPALNPTLTLDSWATNADELRRAGSYGVRRGDVRDGRLGGRGGWRAKEAEGSARSR